MFFIYEARKDSAELCSLPARRPSVGRELRAYKAGMDLHRLKQQLCYAHFPLQNARLVYIPHRFAALSLSMLVSAAATNDEG